MDGPSFTYFNYDKPEQTELCQFCNEHPEYISHLLYDCRISKLFWDMLLHLLTTRCSHLHNFKFSKRLIVLNVAGQNEVIDNTMKLIIINGKFYLYRCKVQNHKPNIGNFLKELSMTRKAEEEMARINTRNMINFKNKWLNYNDLLKGLIIES